MRSLKPIPSSTGFRTDPNEVVFPGPGNERTRIPIAPDGTFDLATLMELGQGEKVADGVVRTSKAFTRQRVWDLGSPPPQAT